MNFIYEISVEVSASSEQEALEKIKDIYNVDSAYLKDAYDDEGNRLNYQLDDKFQRVWYKPACPYGYYDCILDPARHNKTTCGCYDENQDDCDYFDDEDK